MSIAENDQSLEPKIWLKFRSFSDGMPTPAPETSFPQFGLLPPELRLKVWEHLLQPRVIVASCLQRDELSLAREEELAARATGARVPVLLHVNSEARQVALKRYELTFAWKVSKMHNDTPVDQAAKIYFNFETDALLLAGNLEAYDDYGFNQPMVYFLHKDDTVRVKHIACAFREIGHGRLGSDHVFGCLWHIVDRFPRAKRLLLTVGEGDEEDAEISGSANGLEDGLDNVVQRLWTGWRRGTTVTSSRLRDKQMLLVREEGLAEFLREHQE